jgi:hypothetical protein
MRAFGFSTGAVAFGDFAKGLQLARSATTGAPSVELSALREAELEPLLCALPSLDLTPFAYVSVHAPSQYGPAAEREIAQALLTRTQEFNIIVHPDAISNFEFWRPFGNRLCVENMDKRKPRGRNCRELDAVFEELPEASFCLDIGHSRQVDPTMAETREMLRRFGTKLRQVHLSEVTSSCQHEKLSLAAILAFRSVATSLPERIPIILETVMGNPPTLQEMTEEIERAQRALPLAEAGSRERSRSGLTARAHA